MDIDFSQISFNRSLFIGSLNSIGCGKRSKLSFKRLLVQLLTLLKNL